MKCEKKEATMGDGIGFATSTWSWPISRGEGFVSMRPSVVRFSPRFERFWIMFQAFFCVGVGKMTMGMTPTRMSSWSFLRRCLLLALLSVVHAKDFYQLLGVSRDASLKEIKKAYRAKSLEYHRKLAHFSPNKY